jgi:hypothetical protein
VKFFCTKKINTKKEKSEVKERKICKAIKNNQLPIIKKGKRRQRATLESQYLKC